MRDADFYRAGLSALDFRRRALAGIGALCVLAAFFLAGPASRSLAAEHLIVTGEYGKEGEPAAGLGGGCQLGYQSADQHLYLYSAGKIYGLAVTPGWGEALSGSAVPLGGNFPITTPFSSFGNDCSASAGFAVENSVTGQLFGDTTGVYSDRSNVYGWSASGSTLESPWPINNGGENCGLAVTARGEVWVADKKNQQVDKYSSSGVPLGTIPVGFQFCRLAVDNSTGDLYVAPYSASEPILKFTAASNYATSVAFPVAGNSMPGLAINGAEHKLYVGNNTTSLKAYDTETGGLVETVTLPKVGGLGLAVDEGTDILFVAVGSGGYVNWRILEYGIKTPKATTGEPIANSEVSGTADPNEVGPITECYFEFGFTTNYGSRSDCAQSLPITSEEEVTANLPGLIGEETYHYRLILGNGEPNVFGRGLDKTIVAHNVKQIAIEPATEITQESAVLNASFEGTSEDTHYYFEYGQTTKYGHKTAVPPGDDAGTTTGPTHISTKVSGLEPGITYHYRVVAENSIGVSRTGDLSFKTDELPAIDSATSSHITETSAEIDATINPHEFETTYFVEYGTTPEYGSVAPVPHGVLAPSDTAESVTVPLTGLHGVPYHFRIVAESRWGKVETEDQTFNFYPPVCPNSAVRQQNESQYLPDCRAYELVSPEETGNVELTNAPSTPDPYATSPARFAFLGFLGGVKGTEPTNALSVDTYVATRTSTGWQTHLVGLHGNEGTGVSSLFANPDFSEFLDFRTNGGFAGEPQPPHNIPYLWDVEGNHLGRWPANFESIPDSEESNGAFQPSADMNHMAFSSSNVAFTPEGLTTGVGSAYDYNTSTGTTTLISKTASGKDIEQEPGNTSTEEAILFPGVAAGTGYGYGEPTSMYPGVSADGSHILMSTASIEWGGNGFEEKPLNRLYMRVDDSVTYEVSRGQDVKYVGMTADGSKVFFTTPKSLTVEDTDHSVDLYMWSEAGDKLTLISKGDEGAEGSGNSDECSASWVSGCGVVAVEGEAGTDNSIAADSGDIYFYSPEQLEGTKGIPNQENLYVYREGRVQFVAALSPGGVESGPVTRIQVSPNGDHMAFVTASRVTSYNNAGFEEMYSYSPAERKIVCVSCRPNGEPPTVNVEASKMGLFMSNDGRTFFSTEDSLVPTDTNEERDVYEYTEGRPQLITSGTGTSQTSKGGGNKNAEGLAGVSADGVNVYFSTRDILVPQNHNGPFLAFYDARTDGGFPYEPALAPCEAADECHGAGNAPPTPPTVTSEGNLDARGNAPNPTRHKAKRHHKRRHHKRRHKRGHRSPRRGAARHHRQGRSSHHA